MQEEKPATGINLNTVSDSLPLFSIWHEVMRQIFSAMSVVSVVATGFFICMFVFASFALAMSASSDTAGYLIFILFAGGFIAIVAFGLIFKTAKRTRVLLRASALAQANGFNFLQGQKDPVYPGLVFSIGDTHRAYSIVGGSYNQREFKIFNYSYMEGHGKSRSEHNKGVIMVKLPRKLPNVVFDSKSNNFMGNNSLGATFSGSQRFTFEGDFNKHFDVYAPANYGVDVLYFMTPELMALLIDEASKYDIEVVDDNLFFYAPEFDFKAQQLTSIFKIIQTVGGEFSENTERYADERVGNKDLNMVAEPGRRLKKGISWVSMAAIAVYIILQILSAIFENN